MAPKRCRKRLKAVALRLWGKTGDICHHQMWCQLCIQNSTPKVHTLIWSQRKHCCSGWWCCLGLNSAFWHTCTIVLQKVGVHLYMSCLLRLQTSSWLEQMQQKPWLKKLLGRAVAHYRRPIPFSGTWKVKGKHLSESFNWSVTSPLAVGYFG